MSVGLGNRVMNATLMATVASSMLAGLHVGDRDGLWEVTCAPHSWLSRAAQEHELRPRVINLRNGYDLYKPDTWEVVLVEFHELQEQRPRGTIGNREAKRKNDAMASQPRMANTARGLEPTPNGRSQGVHGQSRPTLGELSH